MPVKRAASCEHQHPNIMTHTAGEALRFLNMQEQLPIPFTFDTERTDICPQKIILDPSWTYIVEICSQKRYTDDCDYLRMSWENHTFVTKIPFESMCYALDRLRERLPGPMILCGPVASNPERIHLIADLSSYSNFYGVPLIKPSEFVREADMDDDNHYKESSLAEIGRWMLKKAGASSGGRNAPADRQKENVTTPF